MKNVLLFSGGLDCVALFLHLVHVEKIEFTCLMVNYLHNSSLAEYVAAQYWCDKYDIELHEVETQFVFNVSGEDSLLFNTGTNPIVEARNLALVMEAVQHGDNIYMGLVNEYPLVSFPDARADFVEYMNQILQRSFLRTKKQVCVPFINKPKLQVVTDAFKLDDQYFAETFTCWSPISVRTPEGKNVIRECGICKHCEKKSMYQKLLGSR